MSEREMSDVLTKLINRERYERKHYFPDPILSEVIEHVRSLEAQVDYLKALLKPFAEAAEIYAQEYPLITSKPDTGCNIKFSALEEICLALKEGKINE